MWCGVTQCLPKQWEELLSIFMYEVARHSWIVLWARYSTLFCRRLLGACSRIAVRIPFLDSLFYPNVTSGSKHFVPEMGICSFFIFQVVPTTCVAVEIVILIVSFRNLCKLWSLWMHTKGNLNFDPARAPLNMVFCIQYSFKTFAAPSIQSGGVFSVRVDSVKTRKSQKKEQRA